MYISVTIGLLQGGFYVDISAELYGGWKYFLTVNLLDHKKTLLVDYVDYLRESVATVKRKRHIGLTRSKDTLMGFAMKPQQSLHIFSPQTF